MQRALAKHEASSLLAGRALAIGVAALCLHQSPVAAQALVANGNPIWAGERLTFRVQVDKLHASGKSTMWVEGPLDVRGTRVFVLHSDVGVGFGPIKAWNHSTSWLDVQRMASLRYETRQRHFLASSQETVELFPDDKRWTSSRGKSGESPTDAPLDELSFVYYLRTLPLAGDSTHSLTRHYDVERNPVQVRVVGRDSVRTPAGEFSVIVVEMRVRDPRCTGGEGIIQLSLSDDERRLPVRIASSMPGLGSALFTLESFLPSRDRATTP